MSNLHRFAELKPNKEITPRLLKFMRSHYVNYTRIANDANLKASASNFSVVTIGRN